MSHSRTSPNKNIPNMNDLNLYEHDVEDFSSDVPTDQLPSVEEVRTQAQMMMKRGIHGSSSSSSRPLKKTLMYAGMCLVLVIMIVVSIAIPLSKRGPKGDAVVKDNLKKVLYKIALNGKEDFKDENSYQSHAMNWIIEDRLIHEKKYTYDQLQQRYAMYCLHHAAGGHTAWTNSTGWKRKGMPECRWYGVTCENRLVTRIELRNNGLRGTVPPEVSLIPKLSVLNLNANAKLTGTMPDDICRLTEVGRKLNVKVDCETLTCSCCAGCTDTGA